MHEPWPDDLVRAVESIAVAEPALDDTERDAYEAVTRTLLHGGTVADAGERAAALLPDAGAVLLDHATPAYRQRVTQAVLYELGWPRGLFVPRSSPERFLVWTAPDANRYAHSATSDGTVASASASDGACAVYAVAGPGSVSRSAWAGVVLVFQPSASFTTVRIEPDVAWRTAGGYRVGSAMGVRPDVSASFQASVVVQAFVRDPITGSFGPATVSPATGAAARTESVVRTNQAAGNAVYDWGVQTGTLSGAGCRLSMVVEAGRTYAVHVRSRVVWHVSAAADVPPGTVVPPDAAEFSTILTARVARVWVDGLR